MIKHSQEARVFFCFTIVTEGYYVFFLLTLGEHRCNNQNLYTKLKTKAHESS